MLQTQLLKVKVLEKRCVDNEVAGPSGKRIHHVGGDVHANPALCFDGGGTNVRRTVEMFHLKKRVAGVDRFGFEHVKGGRCQSTRFESLQDSVFVNNPTSSTVHDVTATWRPVLADVGHGSDAFSVDQMMGFIVQIAMNGNVGAVGEQRIEVFVKPGPL